jgi:hypothetical protein
VSETNERFYEGLSKSRDQFLGNLDSLLGTGLGLGQDKLEATLERLEEVR